MSFGFLIVDRLVDMFKSSGVPTRQGADMSRYDGTADLAEIAHLVRVYNNAWAQFPYNTQESRWHLAVDMSRQASNACRQEPSETLLEPLAEFAFSTMVTEPGFMPLSVPEDISALSQLQQGELANELRHHIKIASEEEVQDVAVNTIYHTLVAVLASFPQTLSTRSSASTMARVDLLSQIDDPFVFMSNMLARFMSDQDAQDKELFQPLIRQLYRNMLEASGVVIDPDIPLFANDTNHPKFPTDFNKETTTSVAEKYFSKTPVLELLMVAIPFSIPEETRFEHMHVLAGTGHGKTQTLQHLIVNDLLRPADEIPGMVILDSQGDMLNKLQRLALFDPKVRDSLARRLLIVDPSDVHFAPSLNLFDIQSERLKNYSQKDREQVLAGIIEIYDYIFGGLLGAELTQKQAMVFRFLAQLMLSIPGSTIHTLRDLLIDASPYMQYVAQLPETARGFFETQFFQHGYKATREQILRRLYGVLQNPSFERMFAGAENRLDLFDVLNEGGIVLVNTAKDFMKTESSSMFGRYIIALTFKAAMERAILPEQQRRPTFLWIDEASEYFDDKIDDLLIQARKYKLGLVMAHQYLGQLPKGLPASLMTNTSIKLAGGTSHEDALKLSREMRTTPEFVSSMTKERSHANFAAFVRNITPQAMKLSIPFGTLENMPRMPEEHFEILRDVSRRRLSPQPVAPTEPDQRYYTPPGQDEPASKPTIPLPQDDEFWEDG